MPRRRHRVRLIRPRGIVLLTSLRYVFPSAGPRLARVRFKPEQRALPDADAAAYQATPAAAAADGAQAGVCVAADVRAAAGSVVGAAATGTRTKGA